MSVDDIKVWEKKNGRIPSGAYVLMNSGWGKRWYTPEKYINKDAQGIMHFPGMSKEACEFLVKERDINGVGTDVFCPDTGVDFSANRWPAHQVLLGGGKLILEQIPNLDKLPPKGATLLICPLKVEGASGGQIRLIAILP
jgi:kynurenine formamidase